MARSILSASSKAMMSSANAAWSTFRGVDAGLSLESIAESP
jgi:hypothetical protein